METPIQAALKFSELIRMLPDPRPSVPETTNPSKPIQSIANCHIDLLHNRIEKLEVYRKRCYDLEKSREKWKQKRQQTGKQKRHTVMTAEQDVIFCIRHNITGRKRERMKAEMRKMRVDFFAIDREVDEFVDTIYDSSKYSYDEKVLYANDIQGMIKSRMDNLIKNGKFIPDPRDSNLITFCLVLDKGKFLKI